MKITIERNDGLKIEMEFEKCEYEVVAGAKRVTKAGSLRSTIVPNDQKRMILRAWSGCPTFESFVEHEEHREAFPS